ncbi:MAG: hypothetical protein PVF45_02575 [Anaerolineae bacterium]|jgi:hypothetical protein
MWDLVKIALFVGLALMAGATIGKQGVITGRVSTLAGAAQVTIRGRLVALDFLQFRPGKVYYRVQVAQFVGV